MKTLGLAALGVALMTSAAFTGEIEQHKVTFRSNGSTIAGILYLPENRAAGERLPGVVVTGAWTSIKEQMSGLYAKEMAERGFAALAFDFRGWGESGGEPRYKEDPVSKTADIVAAAEFLTTLPEIDGARISGLGICASAGYMAEAASVNANFRSVSLVAPWLHDGRIVEQVYGGAEGVARLVGISREAEASEREASRG